MFSGTSGIMLCSYLSAHETPVAKDSNKAAAEQKYFMGLRTVAARVKSVLAYKNHPHPLDKT